MNLYSITLTQLTVDKADFTDHDPAISVEQLTLGERSHFVWNDDVDVSWTFEHGVGEGSVDDGGVSVVFARDAEEDTRLAEEADVLVEVVVSVDGHVTEVADRVKGEGQLDRWRVRRRRRIVLPTHPLVPTTTRLLWVVPEVVTALLKVDQLTNATRQVRVADVTVVSEVEEVDVDTSRVTLLHLVRFNTV